MDIDEPTNYIPKYTDPRRTDLCCNEYPSGNSCMESVTIIQLKSHLIEIRLELLNFNSDISMHVYGICEHVYKHIHVYLYVDAMLIGRLYKYCIKLLS